MLTPTKPKHCKIKREGESDGLKEFTLEYPTELFKQANCISTDPEFFYPVSDEDAYQRSKMYERICGSCPIKDACLEWALCHEQFGIWANTTPYLRTRLRKQRGWAISSQYVGWSKRYGS